MIEDEGKDLRMDFTYGPDRERWSSELSRNCTTTGMTVYAGDYERVMENGVVRDFCYLDGNTIAVRENGELKIYLAFTDNLGSILSVIDEDGNKVFNASYDAWGKQTVQYNKIGLRRGYTGHEMLSEFDIINMNGRLYDPVLGRFFSPDNYVQMPDNSQNFNRYSYCLNNPLKYTDPSGNLFGIDDALFFAIASSAMHGAINAAMNNRCIWKGAVSGIATSLASHGIGSWLGHGFNASKLGTELFRAGLHGLANGVISAFDNHGFKTGFACGLLSSFTGSGLQAAGIKSSSGIALGCGLVGGITAATLGSGFFYGTNIGFSIGTLNHGWKTGKTGRYYELDEVVVIGHKYNMNSGIADAITVCEGFNDYFGKCRVGTNGKIYLPKKHGTFNGNQYTKVRNLKKLKHLNLFARVYTTADDANGFLFALEKDDSQIGTNCRRWAAKVVGREIGSKIFRTLGQFGGAALGEGVASVPLEIAGGIAGDFIGGEIGEWAGETIFDLCQ